MGAAGNSLTGKRKVWWSMSSGKMGDVKTPEVSAAKSSTAGWKVGKSRNKF